MKLFEIFPKACTRVFNNINFRLQSLQIGAFHQCYLKCKCETPYFEGELVKKNLQKLKNVLQNKIIFTKIIQCARKGIFYPFSHTLHIFVIFFFFYSRWSKVHSETILILVCKVFKLESFSSVTWNVSVKHLFFKVN